MSCSCCLNGATGNGKASTERQEAAHSWQTCLLWAKEWAEEQKGYKHFSSHTFWRTPTLTLLVITKYCLSLPTECWAYSTLGPWFCSVLPVVSQGLKHVTQILQGNISQAYPFPNINLMLMTDSQETRTVPETWQTPSMPESKDLVGTPSWRVFQRLWKKALGVAHWKGWEKGWHKARTSSWQEIVLFSHPVGCGVA